PPLIPGAPEAPPSPLGTAPSIAIAVNGPLGPLAAMPDSASVAIAVTRTGPLAQPAGAPRRLTTGRVASTRTIALRVSGDRFPEPETATARTKLTPSDRMPSEI